MDESRHVAGTLEAMVVARLTVSTRANSKAAHALRRLSAIGRWRAFRTERHIDTTQWELFPWLKHTAAPLTDLIGTAIG
jgi:hypothetical protein